MLTGARSGEVLSARWDQFDFDTGVWAKPASATKQAEEHQSPLNKPALHWSRSYARSTATPIPFPAGTRCQDAPRPSSRRIGLGCARQARHHRAPHARFAAFLRAALVSSGFSFPVIGELLGHARVETTARYAHIYDEVLREATEKVGAQYAGLVGKRPTGKRKAQAG